MDWLRIFWLVVLASGVLSALATAAPNEMSSTAESLPSPGLELMVPESMPIAESDIPVETLDDAWQVAVASSSALLVKQHLVAAGTAATKAAYADRYPNVNVGAGYTVRDREPAYRIPSSSMFSGVSTLPSAQRDAFAFQSSVEVPLYTSGRVSHGVAAATADRQAAEQDYQAATADLRLRVAHAYVAVLREQQVLDVAAEHEANLSSHLADTQNLLANDQVPHNDLLAAEVALANASQRRLQSQHRLEMHQAQYNRLLERDLSTPVSLAPLTVPPELPSLDSFSARAGEGRPELARLGAQSRALGEQAKAVRAATKPQVELLGQYAFEQNRYRSPEGIAALSFGVEWNALDGARSRHRARSIDHQAASYRRAMIDLRSEIELDIRRSWLAANEALQRTAVAEKALSQSSENLASARSRYNLGVGSDTKVLDAVLLQSEARLNYHHAVCDAVLAACQLRHAVGDL